MVDNADAVIIGSGPNGLVAAATLARAGWKVHVLERSPVAGGAVHSAELTAPGYVHDTYSAFYGLLHSSPVFTDLGLDTRLSWAHFDVPVAAAVDPEHAALLHADEAATVDGLRRRHREDGSAWTELCTWWDRIGTRLLAVMVAPIPSMGPTLSLLAATRGKGLFDLAKMQVEPLDVLATERFADPAAQALVAAGASHADVAVDVPASAPAALILALVAQRLGMPVPVGGAGQLAAALVAIVEEAGGTVTTNAEVVRVVVRGGRAVGVETRSGDSISARRAVLADVGPRALCETLVGPDELPASYVAGLRRYRYGTGVFKVDLALDRGAPWTAEGLERCGVVHLTGTVAAMAKAGYQARSGSLPDEPMLIVGQQTVADPSRAPAGGHTLWIETHVPGVPSGSTSWAPRRDEFLETVLQRLEHHAPGLRDGIVGMAVRTPDDLQAENPNLVGGDLGAGSSALDQQLVFRPVPGWFRYNTPIKGLYLCSASTHPGGGVHGMAGRNCARRVLHQRLRRR